jgi:hypothetical protein
MTTPFPFVAGQVLTAAQLNDIQNLPISDKTASYTLLVGDVTKRTIMNSAGATTITVDDAIFTVGDVIQVANKGAGTCTITAGAGVTINTSGSLALAQYGGGYLLALSASTFTFFNLGGAGNYRVQGFAGGLNKADLTVAVAVAVQGRSEVQELLQTSARPVDRHRQVITRARQSHIRAAVVAAEIRPAARPARTQETAAETPRLERNCQSRGRRRRRREWKQRRERGVGRSSYPIPHSRRNRFNHYYNGITDYRHRRFIHLLPIHSHRNIGDRIMAHFAKIQNNVVVEVLTVNNDDCGGGEYPESEPIGQAFIASCGIDGLWLQTSYHANFRGNYAGISNLC